MKQEPRRIFFPMKQAKNNKKTSEESVNIYTSYPSRQSKVLVQMLLMRILHVLLYSWRWQLFQTS